MKLEDKIMRDWDMQEDKKDELRRKFICMSKNLASSNKKDNNTKVKGHKSVNKKKDTDNSELIKLHKEMKRLNKIIETQKEQIDSLRRDKYENTNQIKTLNKEIESLSVSNNRLDESIKGLEYSLAEATNLNVVLRDSLNKANIKINNQRRNIAGCTTRICRLKNEIRKLTIRVGNLGGDTKVIDGYKGEIQRLNKLMSKKDRGYNIHISNLQKQLRESKRDVDNIVKSSVEYDYGTIKKEDSRLYFENTMGERYDIATPAYGQVVRVIRLGNGYVTLDNVLDTAVEIKRANLKAKLRTVKKKEEATIKFNPYKVLVIGSENKDKYVRTLEKAGLNVEWFDSFSYSERRLREMLNRFDIVICCKEHSKHYATELMVEMQEKEQSNIIKYNIVNKENENSLLRTINYIIENSTVLN